MALCRAPAFSLGVAKRGEQANTGGFSLTLPLVFSISSPTLIPKQPGKNTLPKTDTSSQPARLYDRNFALAILSQTCFVIANTLMAHYSRWIDFLGGDLAQIGWVMGVGATLGLVLRPWMAQWMNRLGARTMWGIGYGVFAAASLSNLLLHDLTIGIYLVRSAIVLGAAIVFASGITYISQIAPDNRRSEAIGILGVGGFLGMMLGPFLGDLFLGSEAERSRDDFVLFFVVAAALNILPVIILLFIRTPARSTAPVTIRLSEFVGTVRRYWPGSILLVDMAFGVCMTGPFVFVASFIDSEPLVIPGVSVLGLFFWFYAGPAIVIRIAGRRLPEIVGDQRLLTIGGLFMSSGMFAFAMVGSGNAWTIVVAALLGGIGHALMFHTMTSLTIATFPSEVRGTGSALALMALDIGTIAGAPILGQVGDRFGFKALFATIGVVCLIATLAHSKHQARDPDKAT